MSLTWTLGLSPVGLVDLWGTQDRLMLDGRCHPPRMTLMNFRAHDFMGSCSLCDQVLKSCSLHLSQSYGEAGWPV